MSFAPLESARVHINQSMAGMMTGMTMSAHVPRPCAVAVRRRHTPRPRLHYLHTQRKDTYRFTTAGVGALTRLGQDAELVRPSMFELSLSACLFPLTARASSCPHSSLYKATELFRMRAPRQAVARERQPAHAKRTPPQRSSDGVGLVAWRRVAEQSGRN